MTTLNRLGGVNLALFSAFTFVSPKPPMPGIGFGRRGAGYKDTVRNILAREEYVVNIADRSRLPTLHASSEEMPEDVSEAEALGVETGDSEVVSIPRVLTAPVSMECRLRHVIEFGETRSRFVVAEVRRFHIRDDLISDGKIDTRALDPICRLGGPNYAALGEITVMPPVGRPPTTLSG